MTEIRQQAEKIKRLIEDLNLTSKLEYDMQPLRISSIYPVELVILFYHYRPQPLFCHMPLDTLYAAGCPIVIEGTAYFDGAIPPF